MVRILFILFVFLAIHAKSSVGTEPRVPCRITVTTRFKTGNEKTRVFESKSARSAVECAEHADLHRTNFYTPGIAEKSVSHTWNDSKGAGE